MKLQLFSCCIPVKGVMRSSITDLQRGEIKLIPNSLYDLLIDHVGKSKEDIFALYRQEDRTTIEEYLAFLEDNEFIFWTENTESFPPINFDKESHRLVDNAIVDFSSQGILYGSIIAQLDALGCHTLQIRSFKNSVSLKEVENRILHYTKSSRIRSIELICCYGGESDDQIISFLKNNRRVNLLCLHSAAKNAKVENKFSTVIITDQIISDASHCGIVDPSYFTKNYSFHNESLRHNNCLYKKISIVENGDIKNCPSLPEVYGNIENSTLEEVLNIKGYHKYDNITKDDIEVCKDCEFRYVCSDCRAFTVTGENLRSKPEKCAYDPYTAKWTE